jgi:hypothetical protein
MDSICLLTCICIYVRTTYRVIVRCSLILLFSRFCCCGAVISEKEAELSKVSLKGIENKK